MISIIFFLSPLLLYLDATEHKIGKIKDCKEERFFNNSAGGWAVVCVFFWIIAVPLYLWKRKRLIERAQLHPVEIGKWHRATVILLLLALETFLFSSIPFSREKLQVLSHSRSNALSSQYELACGIQDIKIKNANWNRDRFGFLHITGELRNGCAAAVGVQLQAVAKDENGQILKVQEFWPASTRNIAIGGNYPFEITLPQMPTATEVGMTIIDVRVWDRDL